MATAWLVVLVGGLSLPLVAPTRCTVQHHKGDSVAQLMVEDLCKFDGHQDPWTPLALIRCNHLEFVSAFTRGREALGFDLPWHCFEAVYGRPVMTLDARFWCQGEPPTTPSLLREAASLADGVCQVKLPPQVMNALANHSSTLGAMDCFPPADAIERGLHFVAMPKTASTSIATAFSKPFYPRTPAVADPGGPEIQSTGGYSTARWQRDRIGPGIWKAAFSMAVIRNPFARLASTYRQALKLGPLPPFAVWAALTSTRDMWGTLVDWVTDRNLTSPQVLVQKLVAFEAPDIAAELMRTVEAAAPAQLPSFPPRPPPSGRSCVDVFQEVPAAVIAEIVSLYRRDFETFGYSTNPKHCLALPRHALASANGRMQASRMPNGWLDDTAEGTHRGSGVSAPLDVAAYRPPEAAVQIHRGDNDSVVLTFQLVQPSTSDIILGPTWRVLLDDQIVSDVHPLSPHQPTFAYLTLPSLPAPGTLITAAFGVWSDPLSTVLGAGGFVLESDLTTPVRANDQTCRMSLVHPLLSLQSPIVLRPGSDIFSIVILLSPCSASTHNRLVLTVRCAGRRGVTQVVEVDGEQRLWSDKEPNLLEVEVSGVELEVGVTTVEIALGAVDVHGEPDPLVDFKPTPFRVRLVALEFSLREIQAQVPPCRPTLLQHGNQYTCTLMIPNQPPGLTFMAIVTREGLPVYSGTTASFSTDQEGDGTLNASSGEYSVEIGVAEAGEYSVMVFLEFIQDGAMSLDRDTIERTHVHLPLPNMPVSFSVEDAFTEDGSCDFGDLTGRWRRRSEGHGCLGMSAAHENLSQLKSEKAWEWCPTNCELHQFSSRDSWGCFVERGLHLILVGDSILRTVFADLTSMMTGLRITPAMRVLEARNNLGGDGPRAQKISFVHFAPDATSHTVGPFPFNLTVSTMLDSIRRVAIPRRTNVCVVLMGHQGVLNDFEAHLAILARNLHNAPCRVVLATPPAFDDVRHVATLGGSMRSLLTSPKIEAVRRMIQREARRHEFPVLDFWRPTSGMGDSTTDGLHYWSLVNPNAAASGGNLAVNFVGHVTSQLVLNTVCGHGGIIDRALKEFPAGRVVIVEPPDGQIVNGHRRETRVLLNLYRVNIATSGGLLVHLEDLTTSRCEMNLVAPRKWQSLTKLSVEVETTRPELTVPPKPWERQDWDEGEGAGVAATQDMPNALKVNTSDVEGENVGHYAMWLPPLSRGRHILRVFLLTDDGTTIATDRADVFSRRPVDFDHKMVFAEGVGLEECEAGTVCSFHVVNEEDPPLVTDPTFRLSLRMEVHSFRPEMCLAPTGREAIGGWGPLYSMNYSLPAQATGEVFVYVWAKPDSEDGVERVIFGSPFVVRVV